MKAIHFNNSIIIHPMKYLFPLLTILLTGGIISAETKPNILYINIDDLGWADLSINGSTYYETPNIDHLASQGMQFTQGYSSSANCAPSRACALTGQQTTRHGVYTVKSSKRGLSKDRKIIPIKNTLFIEEDNKTFAHVLKSAGYKTITIGKWHVSPDPLKNGFDINIAGSTDGGPYTGGYHSPFKYVNLEVKEKGTYLTDKITDEAIRLIKENKAKPFCLYLPYYMIHSPLQAKKHLVEKYKNKAPSATQDNAVYAAMIETMDNNIGRLIASIKAEGLEENTLVVFTSDNGGVSDFSLQTPLRGGKGMYYEGGIREPFFIKWPKVIPANSKCDEPVTNLDFFPTFCELAEIKPPNDKILDGISLVPLFTGKKIVERELYWHFPIYLQAYKSNPDSMLEARDPLFRTRPGSVIRDGDWKLHYYFEDNEIELYNLAQDIGEKNDLHKQQPDKAEELLQKLKKWWVKMDAPIPTKSNPDYNPGGKKKKKK